MKNIIGISIAFIILIVVAWNKIIGIWRWKPEVVVLLGGFMLIGILIHYLDYREKKKGQIE
ncbi:MAG TPA: hypothetical protein P5136_06390 [Methanofastidiosum sp.]|nr:hypothetical protein [Methanofastidiosum sp.]